MLQDFTNDPILLSLFRYWDHQRGARDMPERRDIDPVEMGSAVLPHVVLVEFVGDRVRYRLAGTELVRRFGRDFTGLYMDEVIAGSYLDFINELFADMREHRAPVFSESPYRWDVAGYRLTRRIFLPLGDTDARMSLIGQTFGEDYPSTEQPRVLILTEPAMTRRWDR
jgi:hypothetical protein